MPEDRMLSHTGLVKIDGTELTKEQYVDLVDVRVEQSVHVPDRFAIRMRDPDFRVFDGDLFGIGKKVDIGFVREAQTTWVLRKAEITAVAMEQGAGDRHEIVATGYSGAHRLARETGIYTYVDKSDSDIARDIAGRYSLESDIDSASVTHKYLAQYQTDYAFLTERSRAIGYNWWVSEGKLYFKKSVQGPGEVTLDFGDDLRKFRVRVTGELADTYQVTGWDAMKKEQIVGTATAGSDIEHLGTNANLASPGAGKSAFKAAKRTVGHLPVMDPDEAEAVAKSLAARITGDQVFARGEAVGRPDLVAGVKATIRKTGAKASGSYVVTSVEHVWGAGQPLVSRFVSGGKEAAGLVDLLGSGSGNGRSPHWSRVGLVIGLVTNIQDPEDMGRVKVQLPTMSMEHESAWARIVSLGAGHQRGMMWVPDVGDEVLVGFEHGELRRPVVLGGLWNSVNESPSPAGDVIEGGKVVAYTLRSDSGHVITIGKKSGKETVELLHKDGSTALTLAEDKVVLNASDMPIEVTGAKAITVEATEDLKLTGKNVAIEALQKITLTAKQDVNVEGLNTNLKGKVGAKLEGLNVDVKATGMLKAEASGIASLKGSMTKLG